jgi:hypothetical protein
MREEPLNNPMEKRLVKKAAVILGHALVGWVLCAATMGIGMQLFPLLTALIVYAISAPIFFALVAWNFFKRFRFGTPAQTAAVFVFVVVFLDFFLVALVIQSSLAMFANLLGTWIPFALIFGSTYITGRWWEAQAEGEG